MSAPLGEAPFKGTRTWHGVDEGVGLRRRASEARRRAYQSQSADAALYHTSPVTWAFHAAQRRFTPRFIGTIGWTDEAKKAFYERLPRSF